MVPLRAPVKSTQARKGMCVRCSGRKKTKHQNATHELRQVTSPWGTFGQRQPTRRDVIVTTSRRIPRADALYARVRRTHASHAFLADSERASVTHTFARKIDGGGRPATGSPNYPSRATHAAKRPFAARPDTCPRRGIGLLVDGPRRERVNGSGQRSSTKERLMGRVGSVCLLIR
jgi:hypothetical protein